MAAASVDIESGDHAVTPVQHRLPLECAVIPTEADVRAVFDLSRLPMSFGRAMATPAVARCLVAAARARMISCAERKGKR